jgi:hypothetical protein
MRNGRFRRISPVAAHSGDRLLSEPTAGTQPCRREPLFMPLSGRSLMRLRFGARRRKADFQFLSACVEQLTSCPGGGVIPAPISRRGHSSNCPTVPVFCRTLGAGTR